jgi:hypothetical protein
MAGQVQGTSLTQEQLLQFVITNNVNANIPNVPFFTSNPSFNAFTQYQWTLPNNLSNDYALMIPTITSLLIPSLQVNIPITVEGVGNLTYNTVQESISTNNYLANFIFAQSSNCNQVGQVFTYNEQDIAGNASVTALPFTIDPYQNQCSIYYYPPENSVIFSGESSLNFTMLAQTSLGLKVFSSTASSSLIQDEISGFKNNTFVEVEKNLGSDIFIDYCNYLIDNE